jgi:hypothetical protein
MHTLYFGGLATLLPTSEQCFCMHHAARMLTAPLDTPVINGMRQSPPIATSCVPAQLQQRAVTGTEPRKQ